MKFVLKLPLKDPRLTFEVYDLNFASSDDPISSAMSLREISKKAYFSNSTQGWDKREIILNHPDTNDQFAQMEKKIRCKGKGHVGQHYAAVATSNPCHPLEFFCLGPLLYLLLYVLF